MPYVRRDAAGNIKAVFNEATEEGLEEVDPNDSQLSDFIFKNHPEEAAKRDLAQSDLGMVRVLEDVIDLLIEKGVFVITELPEAAQEKLLARRGLRNEFAFMESMFVNDEEDLNIL